MLQQNADTFSFIVAKQQDCTSPAAELHGVTVSPASTGPAGR